MKLTILLAILMTAAMSFAASSKEEKKVCRMLDDKAYAECVGRICEEWMEETGADECEMDGDGHVAVSECAADEFNDLLAEYNKKNNTNYKCQ